MRIRGCIFEFITIIFIWPIEIYKISFEKDEIQTQDINLFLYDYVITKNSHSKLHSFLYDYVIIKNSHDLITDLDFNDFASWNLQASLNTSKNLNRRKKIIKGMLRLC